MSFPIQPPSLSQVSPPWALARGLLAHPSRNARPASQALGGIARAHEGVKSAPWDRTNSANITDVMFGVLGLIFPERDYSG